MGHYDIDWWQAALIPLYDAGPSPENDQQGQSMYLHSILVGIESRNLKQHRSRKASQTLGYAMRVQGSSYIQSLGQYTGRKSGTYRLRDRTQTAQYLTTYNLWSYTKEAKEAKEQSEAEAKKAGAAARIKKTTTSTNNKNKSIAPAIKKPVVHLIPEEVSEPQMCIEGSINRISVNAYERNRKARKQCIEHHGYVCKVCEVDLVTVYGELGKGYTHVHHLTKIAKRGGRYILDPIKHLLPLCPNCHAMIHKQDPPFDVDELKAIIAEVKRKRG